MPGLSLFCQKPDDQSGFTGMGSLLVPTRDSFHFICLFQGIWIVVLTGWIWLFDQDKDLRTVVFSVRCRFQEQHLVLLDLDLDGFRGYRKDGFSGFVGGFSKGRIGTVILQDRMAFRIWRLSGGYWIGRGFSGSMAFVRIGLDDQRMWTVGFFRGIGSAIYSNKMKK